MALRSAGVTTEQVIVAMAIAGAALYLALRAWRRFRRGGGCSRSGSNAQKKVQLTIGGAPAKRGR